MKSHKNIGAILLILIFLVACAPIGDGVATADVFVWFDENGNGVVDEDEKPLSRVEVGIDYEAQYTNEDGKASIAKFMPGCSDNCSANQRVFAKTPQGYKPTTPTEIITTGQDQVYQFGFELDPSIPTATPYVSAMECKTYPGIEVKDSTVAPDGSLWLGLRDGVAEYDAITDRFIVHNSPSGLYDEIHVGEDQAIWIASQEFRISRYANAEWLTYEHDGLITASDIQLGETSKEIIWFARKAPPNSIISFNKKTGAWQYFTQTSDLKYVIGQSVRLSTDGFTWFAAFDERSKKIAPVSNEKIHWQIYDTHTFTEEEIFQIPNFGWIEDSQIAPDGTIWLTTTQGLAQFTPQSSSWAIHPWSELGENKPSADKSTLAISPDGSIWIGTFGNPLALRYVPDTQNGVWSTYDDRDGLPPIDTLSITPDNTIWFGSGLRSGGVLACKLLKQ